MAKERFVRKNFTVDVRVRIQQANSIIAEYAAEQMTLTLRQLYYQFVARGIIPNNLREYKKLGSIVNDARLAGMIDWDAIEDRTRSLSSWKHWDSPSQALQETAERFRYDVWHSQPTRIEVWVEKEALTGVIERACGPWVIPFFACRGYVSQSEQYAASKRFLDYHENAGQQVLILHFGDHDPSGIDMTRDNDDRLQMFTHGMDFVTVKRLALNENQIAKYKPPPNPAKVTDSRAKKYIERFGDESWELDALDPKVLRALVKKEVDSVLDVDAWDEEQVRQEKARKAIRKMADTWKDK